MSWSESWDPAEIESLEEGAKVRSFALDPAWAQAASLSGYASPRFLAFREGRSIRAACLGLRRSRAGFSKVVCGTNGGVGLIASDPLAARLLARTMWRKWRPSELQIFAPQTIPDDTFRWEPAYTIHLDLRQSHEEIRRNFHKRTRNALSRALHDGITAAAAVGSDVDEALDLIEGTAREKRFALPPRTYLVALHECFGRSGLSEIVVAKRDGQILSVVHILGARGIASWWKGGSAKEGYRLNASTAAHWEAIKIAKERRLETYDLGGTNPSDATYAAIHRYKSSFGGRLVQTVVGSRVTAVARTAKWLTSL